MHPPGAGASALEHILGDRATMPTAAGLLLDQTWRMHPDLCRYMPYNAQIRAIETALTASGQTGLRVETVDKFQGQEAPVVIHSMAMVPW